MPLDDFAAFVDQEGGIFVLRGAAPKPSARLLTAGLFGGFQGSYGVGMRDSSAGVFGLLYRPSGDLGGAVITRCPDVIWDFGDGWGKKNGVMWVHDSKDSFFLCQTAATSTVHGHSLLITDNAAEELAKAKRPKLRSYA